MDTSLEEEWKKLHAAREAFESEKAAFDEERRSSGVEVKLFVGNLGPAATEETVTSLFQQYGTVKEVFLLKDRDGNSKHSCFVKFYTNKEAQAAIAALSGMHRDTDARDNLAVRLAASKEKPQPSYAPPPQAPAPYANDPYGAAFSNAAPYGAPPPVSPYQQPQYGQYAAPVQHQQPPVAPNPNTSHGSGRGPSGANLYVNNLPPASTQQDVQAMFGSFGQVVSIRLFQGTSGLMYGFVSFSDPAAAQTAIRALDGTALANSPGRNLEVREKGEKPQKTHRYTPY